MISDKTLRLVPNPDVVTSALVPEFLASSCSRSQIEVSWGGTSGQKNISQAALQKILIPLPPLEEQLRIGVALYPIGKVLDSAEEASRAMTEVEGVVRDSLVSGLIREGKELSIIEKR